MKVKLGLNWLLGLGIAATILSAQSAMGQANQASVLGFVFGSAGTATINSFTVSSSATVQMSYYSDGTQTGQLRGGKIIDNTTAYDFGAAHARLISYINPLVLKGDAGDGSWTGAKGFTDPAAAVDVASNGNSYGWTAVGAVVNGELPTPYATSFAGKTPANGLQSNSILLAHTWTGDTDLNGIINGDDFNSQLNGFLLNGGVDDGNGGRLDWAQGDTNGDGIINGDDFNNTLNAYLNGGVNQPIWAETAGAATALGGSVGVVPEPGTLVLAFAAAAVFGLGRAGKLLRARRS